MNTSEPATRRARLLVAYEGSHFSGFAINEGVRSVAGVIGDALSLISRYPVHITGAGRTDAGVHGVGGLRKRFFLIRPSKYAYKWP